jgi:hypothetical protein
LLPVFSFQSPFFVPIPLSRLHFISPFLISYNSNRDSVVGSCDVHSRGIGIRVLVGGKIFLLSASFTFVLGHTQSPIQ